MALDPELAMTLNQVIYIAPRIDDTAAGDGVYGTPAQVCARVEPKRQVTDTAPTGEELISQYRLFCVWPVGDRDQIWLPNTDPTDCQQARLPMSVAQHTDEDGDVYCYEVLV